MILAVTGWRGYTDAVFIRSYMDTWRSTYLCSSMAFLHVRVGDAAGADAIVADWCRARAVSHHVFEADWAQGRRAGPQRNQRMLAGQGDPVIGPTLLLVAFPRTDGVAITIPGSGTWGCCIEAFRQGIRVEIPPYKRSGH